MKKSDFYMFFGCKKDIFHVKKKVVKNIFDLKFSVKLDIFCIYNVLLMFSSNGFFTVYHRDLIFYI